MSGGMSPETKFRVKLSIALVVTAAALLTLVVYPIISSNPNPFEVTSPKGQVVLGENISLMGVNYTDAVVMTSKNNLLVLKGNDVSDEPVKISVLTPGWCIDLWSWEGASKGWTMNYNCSRGIKLSTYAFRKSPAHEAKDVFYWYLDSGRAIIFHKNGPVENGELVNMTVSYGEYTENAYFKVSTGG